MNPPGLLDLLELNHTPRRVARITDHRPGVPDAPIWEGEVGTEVEQDPMELSRFTSRTLLATAARVADQLGGRPLYMPQQRSVVIRQQDSEDPICTLTLSFHDAPRTDAN